VTNALTLGGALLIGLAASGHCLLMCGGIGAALGLASGRNARGAPRASLLVAYQLGRIASYSLLGFALGALGAATVGAIAPIGDANVRLALRIVTAATLVFGALVLIGRAREPGRAIAGSLWPRLARVGRRLVPVTTLPRAFAFGSIWGYMPCGFVYTMLLIASATFTPGQAAATMAAFGLGTAPALLVASFGIGRIGALRALGGAHSRRVAAGVLLACATLTLAAPWLVPHAPWLTALLPLGCAS
jgi:sulfite exporter TauE/SafE